MSPASAGAFFAVGAFFGLGVNEGPDLSDPGALASQVSLGAILAVRECFSRIFQQLDDGILARPRDAADRPHRHAFDHQAENLSAGELIHAHQYMTLCA